MNKVEQQGKRFQEVLLSKYDFSYLPKFERFMNVLPPQQYSFFTYHNPKNRAFAYQGTFKITSPPFLVAYNFLQKDLESELAAGKE